MAHRQLAVVLTAGSAAVFVAGLLSAQPGRAALCAAGALAVLVALRGLHRVMKGWVERPARHLRLSRLKAAVRSFLTDP